MLTRYKIAVIALSALAVTTFARCANAGLMYVPDSTYGTLIEDMTTGYQWVPLWDTRMYSFRQVQNHYAYSIYSDGTVIQGPIFPDFQIASSSDVLNMFRDAGYSPTSWYSGVDNGNPWQQAIGGSQSAASSILNMFSYGYHPQQLLGYVSDMISYQTAGYRTAVEMGLWNPNPTLMEFGFSINQVYWSGGTFLFRDPSNTANSNTVSSDSSPSTVPEPSSITLLAISFLGLTFIAKRRRSAPNSNDVFAQLMDFQLARRLGS